MHVPAQARNNNNIAPPEQRPAPGPFRAHHEQQRWDPRSHSHQQFLTEIGSVDPGFISEYYQDSWQNHDTSPFHFIGLTTIEEQTIAYVNTTHMLAFTDRNTIPTSFSIHLTVDILAKNNPLWPDRLLPNPGLTGTRPPFLITSAATGDTLVESYRDPTKGWTYMVANNFGQPLFIMFTEPVEDIMLSFTAFTRHRADQDPIPVDDSLTFHLPLRVSAQRMDPFLREAELISRVYFKHSHHLIAHAIIPDTLDTMENNNDAITIDNLWYQFNTAIKSYNAYFRYITGPEGVRSRPNILAADSTRVISLVRSAPPEQRLVLATLVDYVPNLTTSQLKKFIHDARYFLEQSTIVTAVPHFIQQAYCCYELRHELEQNGFDYSRESMSRPLNLLSAMRDLHYMDYYHRSTGHCLVAPLTNVVLYSDDDIRTPHDQLPQPPVAQPRILAVIEDQVRALGLISELFDQLQAARVELNRDINQMQPRQPDGHAG
jgi:hypothetical protein